jgi:uncharacterized protein YceK
MKPILILFTTILLSGCSQLFYSNTESPEQIIANLNKDLEAKGKSTIGRTKQELLLNWGPPNAKSTDGDKGEIYTYTVSAPFSFGTYTGITNLYINDKGVIYHSNFKYLLQ